MSLRLHGYISAIEPAGPKPREPAQIIDGSGKTLLPGLYDMHSDMDAESGICFTSPPA